MRFDPLNFFKLLLAAFGLRAARRAGSEAIDKGLLLLQFLLLPLKGTELCLLRLGFLGEVGAVVA